jgi:hypothetical protein
LSINNLLRPKKIAVKISAVRRLPSYPGTSPAIAQKLWLEDLRQQPAGTRSLKPMF